MQMYQYSGTMKLTAILLLIVFLYGCKKEITVSGDAAYVSFMNAVAGVQPLSVYIDTAFIVRVPYQTSYRNVQLNLRLGFVSIRDSARSKILLNMPVQEFENNTSSTIIIFDTLRAIDSTVKAIRLSDDLTLAPNGFVKVRFINAAPLMSPVDVTFVRTSITPFDSLTFSSQSYIGNGANVQSLSAFNNIPIGAYTLKIKKAGTQDTIMNTVKLTVSNLAGVAGISGISTFYLTGGVRGKRLEVGSLRHYP